MPDWEALFGSTTLVQAILWIVAAGLLLGLLIKLWPFIKNAVAIVDALVQLPTIAKYTAAIPEMQGQIKSIHHETHRNDGSSIKDATIRIEQSLEGVHGRLDTVETDTQQIRSQVEQLTREDEALWEALDQTNPNPEEEP